MYKFEIYLNIKKKKIKSKNRSNVTKDCKLIFKENNNFGLIKAKKVSIHSPMQIIESKITNLKFFNLLNI